MLEELAQRDRDIVALREENERNKTEATRLRKDLNKAFAKNADKMMDVALEASVNALHNDAEDQRRVLTDQSILCDELRALEAQLDWSTRISLVPEGESSSGRGAGSAGEPSFVSLWTG